MTNITGKAIKLSKANKYNTYQFYAELANKNIDLVDALKYAALVTIKWLQERLEGEGIPDALKVVEPKDYKKANNEDFKSFVYNENFTISVETSIEEGIWALRIIENDNGALNDSNIVPGRIIQSDIAYRITDDKLICGFKTQISDINDVPKAGCVRFKIIKTLAKDPIFGFKNINNIDINGKVFLEEKDLKDLKQLIKNKENELPFIIYTFNDYKANIQEPNIKSLPLNSINLLNINPYIKSNNKTLMEIDNLKDTMEYTKRAPAYQERYAGYGRFYFLPKSLYSSIATFINLNHIDNKEVIIIEPFKYNNKVNRFNYDDKDAYKDFIFNYQRDKEVDFKDVLFLDAAKTIIERNNLEAKNISVKLLDEAQDRIEQFKIQIAREDRIQNYSTNEALRKELDDTLNKLKEIKKDNEKLEADIDVLNKEITRLNNIINEKNNKIEYLNRKTNRPKYHRDISDWAGIFDSIILDKKAVTLLESKPAENVDVDVICDALDYLDTLYSKYLFEGLSEEELNYLSSQIYNRPYEVTPSGIPVSARGDCKVKYAFEGEKRVEHVLDQHLKIGSHGELLRIYFIVDKKRKKIIIGSLPNHLEY